MLCLNRPENKIKKNYRVFLNKKKRALAARTPSEQIKLIEKAAFWAAYNTCGVYASPELEAILCQYAQEHPTPQNITPKPNSRLHVMTTAYKTGGHTRVVDQWIANKPAEQHHDLVILNQLEGHLPDHLIETVKEAGGELLLDTSSGDKMADALKLRELACHYEKVILHHHMEDATPTLAFGTPDFKRPIITFDHAEHMFWLGASVTDISAVLSPDTIPFSMERRGVNAHFLPIPTKVQKVRAKAQARKALDIPSDRKVLLSIGGDFRFKPSKEYNFITFCEALFKTTPNMMTIIVGVSPNNKYWQKLKAKYKDRLLLTGLVKDKDLYYDYIAAADVYVESLPIGGETTSLEVAITGTPSFVLKKPLRRSDVWDDYSAKTINGLSQWAKQALLGVEQPFTKELLFKIKEKHTTKGFQEYLAKIEALATTHKVTAPPTERPQYDDFDRFVAQTYSGISSPSMIKRVIQKTLKKLSL